MVNDGYLGSSLDRLSGITLPEAQAMRTKALGTEPVRTPVNTFVCRWPSRTVMFDTGSGTSDGPTCGKQLDNLAAAGVDPSEIDAVLLTHIHPDHSHGLVAADGTPNFPNARVYVHQAEMEYWLDGSRLRTADDRARRRHYEAAHFQFEPYEIVAFQSGEVLGGIEAIPCPGHTPGHTAFRISTGVDALLIWGDTVHKPEIQVSRPDVVNTFDMDHAQTVASRIAVFNLAARDNMLIAGAHLRFPGLARLLKIAGGYKLRT
jgi:glyoxylase-like metal-dependent hydrolase (beta-lactamase superfamily II)